MKKIEWKRIILDSKESNYMISSSGIVLNTKTNKTMGSIPNKYTGYRSVTICQDGISHTFGIHILVAIYFINKPKVDDNIKLEVNHKDGNKLNNNVSNLEWVTRSENIQHAFRTGLNKAHPKIGIEHWNTKQTEETIHKICKMIQDGYNTFTIVKALNVSKDLVNNVRNGNTWKNISSEYNITNKPILNMDTILPQKSKKYSEDHVRNICKLLESGKSNKDIVKELYVKEGMVSDIRGGRVWRFYSEQYDIVYTSSYKPSALCLLVIECLEQDITSTKEIIEYHKLPDINDIHIYIDNVRKRYMK